MHEHLNDDEAESLLSPEGGSDPLAATLGSMRHHFDSVTPPEPNAALSEFVSADLVAEFTDSTYLQSPTLKERKKMSLSAFVGTAAGKILIGTSVAAASVGGAQITGVIDVPVLPDVNEQPAAEVELPDIGEDTVIEVAASSSSDDQHDAADHADDDTDSAGSVSDEDESDVDSVDSDDTGSDDDSDGDSDAGLVLAARAFDVLDVGTVTIQSDELNGLTIVETTSADGWTVEIDSEDSDGDGVAHEVSVSFRNGDDRVDFKAEVENGALRVRMNDSRTDSVDEMWFDENGNPIADPDSDDDEADEADEADDESDDSSDNDSTDDSSNDDSSDDDSSDDDSSDDDSSDDDSSDDDSSDDDSSDDDSSDEAAVVSPIA